jgi:hypothetical protein
LATIVVFAVRGITDQGQKSSCKATAKTYEVAIEAYYANFGTAGGNPSGADLVAKGLLRTYSGTDVSIVNTAGLSTSAVAATSGGKCTTTSL